MDFPNLKTLARRPPVILTGLLVIAILGFIGVNHLVTRFHEQQKALARRMFRRGESEVAAGNREHAIDSFRAALAYDRGNDLYQLNLARALRDTGRTEESRAYLITLWERKPEDSTINLALARLAARQNFLDDALRYYHNATYGVWPANGEKSRRDAQFELIEFLLRDNAVPQAQAELITMSTALPTDADYHLRLGKFFSRAQDSEHALAQFQQVLRLNRENAAALAGAGQAAFELGHYRSAQQYLQQATRSNPDDSASRQWLLQTDLILRTDPYERRIPAAERERRVQTAFELSGKRLDDCMTAKGLTVNPISTTGDLETLKSRWLEMKSKLSRGRRPDSDANDAAMDLVFQIEQTSSRQCGAPNGEDSALLILAQDRDGVEQ
jgi:tetratricopeptide (TPR) repeat protein